MFEPGKPIVTLTDAAATQARGLVEAAESDIIGLRIGIKTAGCSGLQYDVQYATEAKPFEERLVGSGVGVEPTRRRAMRIVKYEEPPIETTKEKSHTHG